MSNQVYCSLFFKLGHPCMHYEFLIPILLIVGFVAGAVDTIAGGGGLITVPVLMSLGLPPAVALGTNRMQSCMGELSASLHFLKKKMLNLSDSKWGVFYTALGSSLGSILIQYIHMNLARKIIPWLLLGVILYTFLSPKIADEDVQKRMSTHVFYFLFGLGIGFYNGFFGPGTGSFWIFAFMLFAGLNIVSSTMHAKPLNFIGNVASLLWFVMGGNVSYLLAIAMGVGQIMGARLGARIVISNGAALIRPFYLTMVTLLTLSLFLKELGVL